MEKKNIKYKLNINTEWDRNGGAIKDRRLNEKSPNNGKSV